MYGGSDVLAVLCACVSPPTWCCFICATCGLVVVDCICATCGLVVVDCICATCGLVVVGGTDSLFETAAPLLLWVVCLLAMIFL